MLKLFGTSGIRGSTETLFTEQFCFDIGRSFGIFLQKHQQRDSVAVGMDPRSSSPKILFTLEQGLNSEGVKIVDQGAVPVPALNYILLTSSYSGSVMVTGSHISSNMNGIKFFAFREEILKSHEEEITEIYANLKENITYDKLDIFINKENHANEEYQEMLVSLAQGNMPKLNKIIVDPGNGAQSDVMPKVLTRLGFNVLEVNASIQKEFIPRDTEVNDVLSDLQSLVIKEKADLGIAYDYDGDRVVFIDEMGNFVPGDYSGSLIAKYSDSPTTVTPINTSQVAENIGKRIIRTKVGSPYVVQAMKESGSSFGFEANGGGISAEIMMSRDGGSTTIKLLKIMKRTGKSLGELVNELPKYYLYRVKVDCPIIYYQTILDEAKKQFKGTKIEEIDGLKIWNGQEWLLFRPSSNAPEFRVFAESDSQKKATKLGQNGMKFVKDLIDSLK